MIIKKLLLSLLLLFSLRNVANAVMLVEDLANLPVNTISSVQAIAMVAEQVKEYKLAVEEFELMVKNSAAPYFYVYDQVQSFDENVERLQKRFDKFSDKNAVEDYFKKYYDVNYYSSSPCYKAGGCSSAELDQLGKEREERINYMKNISKELAVDMKQWSADQKERYARLKRLNQEAKKAQGHFQIQSYQAQYLSEMNLEMKDINKNLQAMNTFLSEMNKQYVDENNKQLAINKQHYDWQKPKVKKFKLNKIGEEE